MNANQCKDTLHKINYIFLFRFNSCLFMALYNSHIHSESQQLKQLFIIICYLQMNSNASGRRKYTNNLSQNSDHIAYVF